MANSKKTSVSVEQASEKTCFACGYANPSEAAFCGNCGKKLDAGKQCPNCGAPIPEGSKFCMQCGTAADEKVCPKCGTKVGDNYKFCPKCGAPAGGQAPQQDNAAAYGAPAPAYAPPPPPKPKTSFRQKVVDFENRQHLMSNLVVLVMSFIFVFVALFAPIKVAVNGIDGAGDDSYGIVEVDSVDQTIFQVFGAYEYIGLDYNDSYDKRKIDDMKNDFTNAMQDAKERFDAWYYYNSNVSEGEAYDKLYEYLMYEMDDMNMLGFIIVLTTPGVYDAWSKDFGFEGNEQALQNILDSMYVSSVYSLAVATLIAILQIAIAVISLVFMIMAICNLVRKKPSKPFKYLFLSLLLSGIALIVSLLAPNLVPGGAVLAIGILSTLAYMASGLVAYTQKNNYLEMIRRGILCFLGLIVFFSVTANNITFHEDVYEIGAGGADYSGSAIDGSFGMGLSGLFSYFFVYRLNDVDVTFTATSAASMVFVTALGIITTAVLFFMLLSFLRNVGDPDSKPTARTGTWLTVAGAACMLVLSIGCAVLGSIGNIPSSDSISYMLVNLYANANSGLYATFAFALIAIVFDFVYSAAALKKPKQQAVAATLDSVSSSENSEIPPVENVEQPTEENVEQPTEEQ